MLPYPQLTSRLLNNLPLTHVRGSADSIRLLPRLLTLTLSLLASAALTSANALASTYSAVNDFSLATNPNGNWSYSEGSKLLPNPVVGSGYLSGVDYRWSGNSEPNSDVAGKNVTNGTLSFETIVLPVGYLWLDPESQPDVGVSFVVPTAGKYDIAGSFRGIDTDEESHPVDIAE